VIYIPVVPRDHSCRGAATGRCSSGNLGLDRPVRAAWHSLQVLEQVRDLSDVLADDRGTAADTTREEQSGD
jgi:hypothetical protein